MPNLISIFVKVLIAASMLFVVLRVYHPRISDSGWFWLFIFSGMGLLGLLVIGPKYDDRQKRLEGRYDARERIAQRRANQPANSTPSKLDPSQTTATDSIRPSDAALAEIEPYDYPTERKVPLTLLGTILGIATAAAGAMLVRTEYPKRQSTMTGEEPHA